VSWCRSEDGPGFNDARKIDRQTLLDYAGYLRQQVEHGELTIATAQNRLSSVNRTMAALRGDQYVKVLSPSKALGMQRTTVRTTIPQGQDRDQVMKIIECTLRTSTGARCCHCVPGTSHRYAFNARPFLPTFRA
jgi:hypothetical protein